MMVRRRHLYMLGLLVTVAAVYLSDEGEQSVMEPVARVVIPAATAPVMTMPDQVVLALDKLPRVEMSVGEFDPFAPKSWYVPPPVLPSLVSEEPSVPPLPFRYIGKLVTDGDNWIVYLAKDNASFVLEQGEIFDGSYRLEGWENGNLVIEYLPLKMRQILSVDAAL